MKLFWSQTLLYVAICVNVAAVSHGHMGAALLTDAVIASLNFWIIRNITSTDDARSTFLYYLSASLVGTAVGVSVGGWIR